MENDSDEEDVWNPTNDELLDVFSCVECDYTSRNQNNFKQHMTIHNKRTNLKRKTVPERTSTSKKIKQTNLVKPPLVKKA